MNRRFFAGASLALSLFTLPAHAEGALPALSLSEMARLARNRNLSVATEAERVRSAQALTQAARSPYYPSAAIQEGLNAGTGRALSQTGAFLEAPGLTTSVSGSWLLWDAGNTHDAVAVAQAEENMTRSGLDQAQQDAMLNGGVDYFQLVRAQALAKLDADALKQAEEHLRLGQLRQLAGTATRADVLQLQAQLANAQNTMIQADNAAAIARLTLSNALNSSLGDRAIDASASVPVRSVNFAQELPSTYTRRPEIQQQQFKVESDRARAALDTSSLYPSVSATARYYQLNAAPGATILGATLNWSVFEGVRAQNQAASAEADVRADEETLEQLKQAAELDVRTQYQSSEEARARISSARAGRSAAAEAYRIAVDRYRLGLATNFELIDVQNTYLQAEYNLVQATNDFSIDEIRLTRALGYDLSAYLGAR